MALGGARGDGGGCPNWFSTPYLWWLWLLHASSVRHTSVMSVRSATCSCMRAAVFQFDMGCKNCGHVFSVLIGILKLDSQFFLGRNFGQFCSHRNSILVVYVFRMVDFIH